LVDWAHSIIATSVMKSFGRSSVIAWSVPGAVRVAPQYRNACVTEAPFGRLSTEVLRAWATVMLVLASAAPSIGESARQNRSGAESVTFWPHMFAFTVPTTGAGVPGAQSCPSVLPIRTKSPCWLTWTLSFGAAFASTLTNPTRLAAASAPTPKLDSLMTTNTFHGQEKRVTRRRRVGQRRHPPRD
jgi:hypothetical protein